MDQRGESPIGRLYVRARSLAFGKCSSDLTRWTSRPRFGLIAEFPIAAFERTHRTQLSAHRGKDKSR